jgi:hypothetical protein
MSQIWPFLRDVVYTMLFWVLVFTVLIRCLVDISRWLRLKLIKRRRRLAIKRFADLESGETYFL